MLISANGAQVIGPMSGGKVTPINNLGTSAILIVGPNPQRASLTIANPGSQIVYAAPLVNAQGNTFTPTLSALGGCFPISPGTYIVLTGEVTGAYQALAAANSNNPLTIAESNL